MQTMISPRRFLLTFAALLTGLHWASAVTLSISPGTVPALYAGNITLQINGLTNGETVLVERFIDLNTNGVVDAGEPLVQSMTLTDGQAASIGGAREANVPGDNDLTANGQITATFNFSTGPEFSRANASYIFRVSSPGGHFAPVQQVLTVTQTAYPQQVTGNVSSGGSPVANAMVAVLVQVGNDSKFISGTVADGSGNFALQVSNGTYVVVAFKQGYYGSFATGPTVTVAGANTNVSVSLTAGNYTVSGSVTDASSSAGLPGMQMFVTSTNNQYLACFTDSSGNFTMNLTTGKWKFEPSDASLELIGYFRANNKAQVTVTAGNVTGFGITCYKGTAMIYGTLKDDSNNPLSGVSLNGNDNGNLYTSNATTDTNGNFYMMANAATWNVGASSSDSGLPAGDTLQSVQIALTNGQAVQTNLVAHHASAWLAGRATDSNSNPISGGSMIASTTNNQYINVQLANDGSFAVPVSGGSWSLALENGTAASYNVVAPILSFAVTDGVNISNIVYVAPISTRTISGWVRTGAGTNITGLNVFAGAFINGTNYIAGGNTDNTGSYSFPVLPGVWNVGADSQGLSLLGYVPVPNQNADTTSANQTVNFVVSTPSIGSLFFRHSIGVVGEFGRNSTPTVTYPVTIKNYRAIYYQTDTNPPTASQVLFTGPPGSGLTNMPADPGFGAVQVGNTVYFFSPPVRNPSIAMGGTWTINYNGNFNYLNVPDPQAASRIVVPVPTINLQKGILHSLQWSYRDQNGTALGGPPPYVVTNRVDLFDQNVNGLDSEIFPATSSYTWPATNSFPWADISLVRVDYYDNMTNQYFVGFSESSPSITSASYSPGRGFQFVLNGAPGQNFTIQYTTNVAGSNWNTLYVTNFLSSPVSVSDPNPSGPVRFYRVLVGP